MASEFSIDTLGSWFALAFIFIFIIRAGFVMIESDYTKNKDGNVKKKFRYTPKTFFSPSGLLNFIVGFCMGWDFIGISSPEHILTDIIIGLFTAAGLPYLLYLLSVHSQHGKYAFPDRLIYRIGTVETLTEKSVVIRFSTHDKYGTLNTFPDDGYTVEDFAPGDLAFISSVGHTDTGGVKLCVTPYKVSK